MNDPRPLLLHRALPPLTNLLLTLPEFESALGRHIGQVGAGTIGVELLGSDDHYASLWDRRRAFQAVSSMLIWGRANLVSQRDASGKHVIGEVTAVCAMAPAPRQPGQKPLPLQLEANTWACGQRAPTRARPNVAGMSS